MVWWWKKASDVKPKSECGLGGSKGELYKKEPKTHLMQDDRSLIQDLH
jgi:hypothetical protein